MEMSSEQGAALVHIVQMVEAGETHSSAVLGRRSSTNFIHDDKGTWGGLPENRSRLKHLNHERGLVTEEVVCGTDSAEDLIHDPDLCMLSRNKGTHLREDSYECILPKECALAGHVGARDEPYAFSIPHKTVVAHEWPALFFEPKLHSWVSSAHDFVVCAIVEYRSDHLLLLGQGGKGAGNVDLVQDRSITAELHQIQDHLLA
jgi:hypothetical protein